MERRKLVLSGMLTALALALAYLEHLIPLQAIVPIPGIRLGLPNTATLFALVYLGRRYGVLILISRCLLQNLLFGTATAFFFSLSGGLLAFAVMALLIPLLGKRLSLIGVSVAGAACHNIGQTLCAIFVLQSGALLTYLPFLLIISVFSGSLTGYICHLLFSRLKTIALFTGK